MADVHLSNYDLKILPSERLINCLNDSIVRKDNGECPIKEFHKDGSVSMQDIRELADYLRKDAKNRPHLHDLLSDCQISLPKPPVPERNPELEARIQVLKAQQQDKEYVAMTKGVDATYRHKHSNEFRKEVKTLRAHMAASVNFVITVGACFLFGYKAIEYIFPNTNLAGQCIAGVIAGFVGGLADLYFLAKQLEAEP